MVGQVMEQHIKNSYKKYFKDGHIAEDDICWLVYKAAWITATQDAAQMMLRVGKEAPNYTIQKYIQEIGMALLDGKYDAIIKPKTPQGSHGLAESV
jgi:hypothetical protein